MANVSRIDIIDGKPPALVEGGVVMSDGRVAILANVPAGALAVPACLTATGLPSPWSQHPTLEMLNLVGYEVTLLGGAEARVICNYVNTAPQLLIRRSSALETYQTDMDRQKRPVLVSNFNPSANPPVNESNKDVRAGVLNLMRPQPMIAFRRVFPDPQYGGPDPSDIEQLVGSVNSTTMLKREPGTLMLWSFDSDNAGMAGIAYRAEVVFRHRKQGWNPEVAYFDPTSGEPGAKLLKATGFDAGVISDPSDTNVGRKIVDGYDREDLSFLIA